MPVNMNIQIEIQLDDVTVCFYVEHPVMFGDS